MSAERKFSTVYDVRVEKLALPEGIRDLYVTWVDERMDSEEIRRDVLIQLAQRLGIPKLPRRTHFSFQGAIPPDMAGETKISICRPRPPKRVVIKMKVASQEEVNRAFEFEAHLEDNLSSEVGIVDGNDVGQGEYNIYCFGVDREELKTKIVEIANSYGIKGRF